MKQTIHILTTRLSRFTALSILSSFTLLSQPSASNQVVTLEVLELNKVTVSKDLLALNAAAYLENGLEGSVISAQTRLVWTSNGDRRKISVASRQASKSCVVRINLHEINGQIAVRQQLELTDTSTHDFIRGLSRSAGGCEVGISVFMMDPEGAQGHFHSILYTVTSS